MNKLYCLKKLLGYIMLVLIVLAAIKIVVSTSIAILSFLTNVATVVVIGCLIVLAMKLVWHKLVK